MSVRCKKIEPNNEIDKLLYKTYTTPFRQAWIEVGEENFCMPEPYAKIADKVENFEIKDSDIFLTSHPKTGTTWLQEMLWMIVHDLDFERGKVKSPIRVPFLEFEGLLDFENDLEAKKSTPYYVLNSLELLKNTPDPRIIKTHMPFCLLPKQVRNKTRKPKIFHIIRNAKDTCVSYYHHCSFLEGFNDNLDSFCKLFIAGRLSWGPYWKNVLTYWTKKEEYNIFFVSYEEMKKDLRSVILKVADYLEKPLTEEQIDLLEKHLSFEQMKKNPSVNQEELGSHLGKVHKVQGHFMRSGTIGSYKKDMDEDMIKKIDEWTKKELAGSGLAYENY